jgi:hypothetical protein
VGKQSDAEILSQPPQKKMPNQGQNVTAQASGHDTANTKIAATTADVSSDEDAGISPLKMVVNPGSSAVRADVKQTGQDSDNSDASGKPSANSQPKVVASDTPSNKDQLLAPPLLPPTLRAASWDALNESLSTLRANEKRTGTDEKHSSTQIHPNHQEKDGEVGKAQDGSPEGPTPSWWQELCGGWHWTQRLERVIWGLFLLLGIISLTVWAATDAQAGKN